VLAPKNTVTGSVLKILRAKLNSTWPFRQHQILSQVLTIRVHL